MSSDHPLVISIVDQIDAILLAAEEKTEPIEIDPYRDQLFELFVTAEAAEGMDEDSEVDMNADFLCHQLSLRWGLTDATRQSVEAQTKLPPEQLAKMRLLWSLMRMWMEWSYAWERWAEFHPGRGA